MPQGPRGFERCQCRPHLGDRSPQHEAEDLDQEGDACDEDMVTRKIYEEQKLNEWPGLVTETEIICKELGIEDCKEGMQKNTY